MALEKREKVGLNRAGAQSVLAERIKEVRFHKEFGTRKIENILFEDFGEQLLEKFSKMSKRSWDRDEIIMRKRLNPVFGRKFLTEIAPAAKADTYL